MISNRHETGLSVPVFVLYIPLTARSYIYRWVKLPCQCGTDKKSTLNVMFSWEGGGGEGG